MAPNTAWWFMISWRYFLLKIPHILNLLLQVSCLRRTRACNSAVSGLMKGGHLTNPGKLLRYPLSHSTFSPGSSMCFKCILKIMSSLNWPGGKPPVHQTISPVRMQMPTSYRRPIPLNLNDQKFWLYTIDIWKSVPSIDVVHSLPISLLSLFSHKI